LVKKIFKGIENFEIKFILFIEITKNLKNCKNLSFKLKKYQWKIENENLKIKLKMKVKN